MDLADGTKKDLLHKVPYMRAQSYSPKIKDLIVSDLGGLLSLLIKKSLHVMHYMGACQQDRERLVTGLFLEVFLASNRTSDR